MMMAVLLIVDKVSCLYILYLKVANSYYREGVNNDGSCEGLP